MGSILSPEMQAFLGVESMPRPKVRPASAGGTPCCTSKAGHQGDVHKAHSETLLSTTTLHHCCRLSRPYGPT